MDLAERLLIEGTETVQSHIRKLVKDEQTKMINKRGEQKSRIFIQKSRLLFGICDPYGVLKDGQCYVRVTAHLDGEPRTIINTEVLVTRNPCLHPGDLRKFKAIECPQLSHLVDCIVFPTRGKRAGADLMSGGDLDGDKFFVCWDPDIIPRTLSEPAEYPGGTEPVTFGTITDDDRIKYFAEYTSVSLGQVKNLYLDWARLKGPMSAECQQLNRLFSQCVDGNRIKIPEHFKDPPKPPPTTPFIVDVLHEGARSLLDAAAIMPGNIEHGSFDALELLLSRDSLALSEFELIQLALRWCDKNHEDFAELAPLFNFNSLSDQQKAWTLTRLPTTENLSCLVMNGLMQSAIASHTELKRFGLHHPGLRWKRVFDSNSDRMGTFLSSTSRILEIFHKKLILLRIDERLSVAIYVPKKIESHQECEVDSSVRVFAFPHSQGVQSPNYVVVPTKAHYRLFCDSSALQLYQSKRSNTWIFLQHGPLNDSTCRNTKSTGDKRRQKQITVDEGANFELRASIALDKINKRIKTHVGRVNQTGVLAAEVYVISNRDVKSLQKLDEWLNYIDTENMLPLFEQEARAYTTTTLKGVDWLVLPEHFAVIARDGKVHEARHIESVDRLTALLDWLLRLRQFSTTGTIYRILLEPETVRKLSNRETLGVLLQYLPRVPWVSGIFLGSQSWHLHREETPFKDGLTDMSFNLLCSLVLCASRVGDFIMEPLQSVLREMRQLRIQELSELVELIALAAPSAESAMKMMLEIIDPETTRLVVGPPVATARLTKQLFGIALEHADETEEAKNAKIIPNGLLLDLTYKHESKGFFIVECKLRVDAKIGIRTGDHVRLTPASPPENEPVRSPIAIDAIVESADMGLGTFRCLQDPPEYLGDCSWHLLNCGSFTSGKTMMDAVSNLYTTKLECCRIYDTLALRHGKGNAGFVKLPFQIDPALNRSQNQAIESAMTNPVSLLWGPPGTGKTRTVVAILLQLLVVAPDKRILVAAPTHNAVDNILRKFIEEGVHTRTNTTPIRVSTDSLKI
ncbi:hypothetical protein BU16DRAFT_356202 [Lophium mytilinum]|uniref:RNA-dependent RNA polymerase n=1 Tax=Lophium mytilinum TaxID=390894 RepID=A0A6A6QXJ2_9PEZI|nr:hypothetical protein BU16DRAFT_356202 [Lophium mytilinum]